MKSRTPLGLRSRTEHEIKRCSLAIFHTICGWVSRAKFQFRCPKCCLPTTKRSEKRYFFGNQHMWVIGSNFLNFRCVTRSWMKVQATDGALIWLKSSQSKIIARRKARLSTLLFTKSSLKCWIILCWPLETISTYYIYIISSVAYNQGSNIISSILVIWKTLPKNSTIFWSRRFKAYWRLSKYRSITYNNNYINIISLGLILSPISTRSESNPATIWISWKLKSETACECILVSYIRR